MNDIFAPFQIVREYFRFFEKVGWKWEKENDTQRNKLHHV